MSRSALAIHVVSDYLDDIPVKTIAARRNIDVHVVFGFLGLRIPRRRGAPKLARALIASDYVAGVPIADIAADRSCSPRTVRRAVQELDLPRRHPAAWGRTKPEAVTP